MQRSVSGGGPALERGHVSVFERQGRRKENVKVNIVLLGDSIFDNSSYVPGEPSAIEQLRSLLPSGSTATLLAVDGSVTNEVVKQAARLPADASHLIVSSGGNDALHASIFLDQPGNLLAMLAVAQEEFRIDYRRLLQTLRKTSKPTVACTIYDSIPALASEKKTALSIFNDVIVSEASRFGFPVIDLRPLCNETRDYSALSPIEPSSRGGMKIATRIARVAQGFGFKFPWTILL